MITSLMFLTLTGSALFRWLYSPSIKNIISRMIILYVGIVVLFSFIIIVHYVIPIPNFNVNERTIEQVGIEYKTKWLPKWIQFYGHILGKTLIGPILLT